MESCIILECLPAVDLLTISLQRCSKYHKDRKRLEYNQPVGRPSSGRALDNRSSEDELKPVRYPNISPLFLEYVFLPSPAENGLPKESPIARQRS